MIHRNASVLIVVAQIIAKVVAQIIAKYILAQSPELCKKLLENCAYTLLKNCARYSGEITSADHCTFRMNYACNSVRYRRLLDGKILDTHSSGGKLTIEREEMRDWIMEYTWDTIGHYFMNFVGGEPEVGVTYDWCFRLLGYDQDEEALNERLLEAFGKPDAHPKFQGNAICNRAQIVTFLYRTFA